jgi:hypothetical protein
VSGPASPTSNNPELHGQGALTCDCHLIFDDLSPGKQKQDFDPKNEDQELRIGSGN